MKNLLVKYNYSPGICDIIRVVDLEIFDDFSYKLTMIWYKKYQKGDVFDENYTKSARIRKTFEDCLPENTSNILKTLISLPDFQLKSFYPELTQDDKKQYTPLDVRHENYYFHKNGNRFWINVSPYIFKKEFLKTEQELLFLNFHESLSLWVDKFHEKLIEQE